MKSTCSFYIIFQVLKELLIIICKIQLASYQIFYFLLFLLAFTSTDAIFQKFLELHSTLSGKKRFTSRIFLFWWIHSINLWELLKAISRSDFIIIGSHLTTKLEQTMPLFQNIQFKSSFSMVQYLKSTNLFKYIQEVSTMPSWKVWNN